MRTPFDRPLIPLAVAVLIVGACSPGQAEPSPTVAPSGSESPAPPGGDPTQTVFLPYVAKTLGGPGGWETPFIVQNTDTVPTALSMQFFRVPDGSLVASRDVHGLAPGTSFALRPNVAPDLPDDVQLSAVIRSYGANVVAIVNEQRGAGPDFESDAYTGATGGLPRVFLPRVSKNADGFVSRIMIQNIGRVATSATVTFQPSDGPAVAIVRRDILPGRTQVIDLGTEATLRPGRYAATVEADQPLTVLVNAHHDGPDVRAPLLYSYTGHLSGANNVYGPYAVRGLPGLGRGTSTIAVQNMSSDRAEPSLTFTPITGGPKVRLAGPAIVAAGAWEVDLDFPQGDRTKPQCAAAPDPGCLPSGEYSFVASAAGGQLAVLVTTVGQTSATAYGAISRPSDSYLPNVTRTLGGLDGWSTPIVVQSVTATSLTVSWYRFTDGGLVTRQKLAIVAGTARRIDPRDVKELADDRQYSVVVSGDGGRVVAVVIELNFMGGDGAAMYAGLPR